MIKINQPADLTLTVSDTSGATSATIRYYTPAGETGVWTADDGVALDAGAGTVTYSIPADTLDEVGVWRFLAVVTFSDDRTYPGQAYTQKVEALSA